VVLWYPTPNFPYVYRAITVSGRLFQNRSTSVRWFLSGPQPPLAWVWTVSLSLATTRKIVSVPLGTKMFQFPRFPPPDYEFIRQYAGVPPRGFPHSDIFGSSGCTPLTEAYRSVPRPSSAVDAKASTVRS
jgi:hypothetical protein